MKTVLIAEDEKSIRDFIVINLKRSGYDVLEAENGKQAADLFDTNNDNIDVVVLDIMMPEMDGMAVCKHIREKNAGVGIILLTAKAQEIDKISGLMSGADDYVTKPFSPSELMARVDAVYRRVSLLKERETQKADDKIITLGDFSLHTQERLLFTN